MQRMYSATLLVHSLLRWVVLGAGLAAAGRGIAGWSGRPWTAADARAGLIFIIAVDIQLLIGLLLYVVLSPNVGLAIQNPAAAMRDPMLRFFFVEHMVGMLIAVVLAHVGRARSKGASRTDASRHRSAAIFFGLALLIMLASIPWPFMPAGRPLFPWS
jgi:hypothetical protein